MKILPGLKVLKSVFLLNGLILLITCNGQPKKRSDSRSDGTGQITIGDTVQALGKEMDHILKDRNGNYWFTSNGEGVYCFDGKILRHITRKDGLLSNFVWSVSMDLNGVLWFNTRDGICKWDGNIFSDYSDLINIASYGKLKYTPGGLFFSRSNGMCFYDGKTFSGFKIHPDSYTPPVNNASNPYSVYSTLVDKEGNIWFGTQEKGVCRYDGNSFVYFTDEGLDKAAVRTLFQDKNGTLWAGNNGAGLFRFNGERFVNFTNEKGLSNPGFLQKLGSREGTLARPWTINEDSEGNLWIGTIDAGVWKYDGTHLVNFNAKDGLEGNSIWFIYRNPEGELWFIVNGMRICKYNGKAFTALSFN